MKSVSFKRGIHPPHFKGTAALPIKIIAPQKAAVLVYPMLQHIGAPCEPVVAVGDYVSVGQKIGDSKAVVSAPIHSGVSGVVKEIRQSLSPQGQAHQVLLIENDGEYKEHPPMQRSDNYKSIPREELLTLIREAGIVGLGGAGFPTHVKLSPPPDKKIDTFFVNAAECEPYLTTDHRKLLEKTEKVLSGLEVALHMFPEARGIIAVEDNKYDAIEKLRETNNHPRITVMSMKAKYPQGAEKQIIHSCIGREVPLGGLPMDVGCIVNNVDTVIAIGQAVLHGLPLTRKVVTVDGGAVAGPGNYEVRLGMTFRDLIEQTGGLKSEPHKIIVGGPMTGKSQSTLDIPVTKTSAAILLLTEEEAYRPPERNCFRCGECVNHCPMGLVPLELNAYALAGDIEKFAEYNGGDCIQCASCSYICPSHRNVSQPIDLTRQKLLEMQKAMKK